jgi:hypothetical protein
MVNLKIPKRIVKLVLFLVIFLQLLGLAGALSGCSMLHPHQPKSLVIVEKPPLRTIYVDFEKDITPGTVYNMMDKSTAIPYHSYKFNQETKIIIDYDADVAAEKNYDTSYKRKVR